MPKMLRIRHRTICALLYSLALSASYVCTCRATEIDFGRDIQPILAEKCLNCHGVDNAESGLRLDNRQSALKQTESGEFAIVPQKIQESELLRRIRSSDIELRMPPEGEPLTDEQIQKIGSWISQGANWDDQDVANAFSTMRANGITLLNQSIILKGVNDSSPVLKSLSEALFSHDVLPYYLHLPDAVRGTGHFRVDARQARAIVGELTAQLPGYLVPKLVQEIPGELSKTGLPALT